MTYMLLIYTPDIGRDRTKEEWAEMAEAFIPYNDYVKSTGYYIDGAPLDELSTATTVRIRDGKFAETKEFLGGYYMIDCPSIDEAIEIAARCPAAHFGSMEVRPVLAGPGLDAG
jgi:hypothetical protein